MGYVRPHRISDQDGRRAQVQILPGKDKGVKEWAWRKSQRMRQKSDQEVAKENQGCVVPGAKIEENLQKIEMGQQ